MAFEAVPRDPPVLGTHRAWVLEQKSRANSWKQPVRVVSTSNITLSGRQTIDGVALVPDNRVLCTAQTTGANNIIWTVKDGTWLPALDMYKFAETAATGSRVAVQEGALYARTTWALNTVGANIPQTTTLSWSQVPADLNSATPTSAVNWGGQRLTNLATPTVSTDAISKAVLDSRVNIFAQGSGSPVATVVSTNVSTQLVSVSTPAAVASDEFVLRFTGDQLNTVGSNQTFVIQGLLGGVQMFTMTSAAQGSGASRGKWNMTVNIKVEAVGGSPVVVCSGWLDIVATNNAPNWATPGRFSGMLRTTSVNLAAASTFVLNITPLTSSSLLDWRLIDYLCMKYHS